jgi:hypothetical protein
MGLWSAAYLGLDTRYRAHAEEMDADEYFQEIRLRNLLGGLGWYRPDDDRQRLLFARVLIERDCLSGAGIATRVFETLLDRIASRLRIGKESLLRRESESVTGALVRDLDGRQEMRVLGVNSGDLLTWWGWRNGIIHPDRTVAPQDAREFVRKIDALWQAYKRWARI